MVSSSHWNRPGLYFIEFAALAIASMLEDYAAAPEATVRYYNRISNELFQEILGFINLHYVTSKRRDTPFWQAATAGRGDPRRSARPAGTVEAASPHSSTFRGQTGCSRRTATSSSCMA
jgi:hypothetical protein